MALYLVRSSRLLQSSRLQKGLRNGICLSKSSQGPLPCISSSSRLHHTALITQKEDTVSHMKICKAANIKSFHSSVSLMKKFEESDVETVRILDPAGQFLCTTEMIVLKKFCQRCHRFTFQEFKTTDTGQSGNTSDDRGLQMFQLVDKRNESMDKSTESTDKSRESMDKSRERLDKRNESMDKRKESMDKRKESMDRSRESMDKSRDIMDKSREGLDKRTENSEESKEKKMKMIQFKKDTEAEEKLLKIYSILIDQGKVRVTFRAKGSPVESEVRQTLQELVDVVDRPIKGSNGLVASVGETDTKLLLKMFGAIQKHEEKYIDGLKELIDVMKKE